MIARTQPFVQYGRRSVRGILGSIFWTIVTWPLVVYSIISDKQYGDDFPIYYWIHATKN